jgi:hypothetical protein
VGLQLKFGIKNIRRLRDVPPIELKPITLLVGRNSSGKSSFLRTFPFLRQSLMTRTSSPILWYGDLVDFGTYSTAVSSGAKDNEVSFSFELDRVEIGSDFFWTEEGEHYESAEREHYGVSLQIVIGPIQIERTISRPPEAERTTVRKLILESRYPEIHFEMDLDARQRIVTLKIDGLDLIEQLPKLSLQITAGTFLPEILFVTQEEDSRTFTRRRRGDSEIAHALLELVLPRVPKALDETLVGDFLLRLLASRPLTREETNRAAASSRSEDWSEFIRRVTDHVTPDGFYAKFRSLVALAALADLLRQVDQQLRNILSGVLYIGPARARSERYYRYQDLSVSEIDPDGKNFPMFLNSLSYYQMERLSDWIKSLFGYGIRIRREGGHISIDLVSEGHTSNIVDTGYGVSQILPVLGQIWWARSRPPLPASRQRQVSLLAIEQPELHLHPAHQALLADALVGEVGLSPDGPRGPGSRIHFVVETHSETLVNRLGELVGAGKLNHADVQIVLFEPDSSVEQVTTIRTSSFNEAGELVDWPYGFFQPSIL